MRHVRQSAMMVISGPLLALAMACGTIAGGKAGQVVAVKEPMNARRRGKTVIVTLASAVQEAVRKDFPGFSPPRFSVFDPDVLESGAEDPKPWVPFAAVADFDGNRLPDIALLLKNRRNRWLLVALHQTSRGTFRSYRLGGWQEENPQADVDIRVLPAGYAGFPFSATGGKFPGFDIPHPGIIEEIPGESGSLYYFKGGTYRHVLFGW